MTELRMLERMAARYSEVERQRIYLVGLMNLAVRAGDAKLLATAKERLREAERECNECSSALRDLRREMLSAGSARDGEDELAAVSQTCEYATA